MAEEYKFMIKNSVWEVVPRPTDNLVVGSRWIFKIKHAANKNIKKYKAIILAKGFSQVERIDYEETFVPITRYSSIRSILALVAQMGWKIHQMDIKTTFLNGVIEEEVHIKILEGQEKLISSCKEDLAREFEIKDMGLMHYFLGLEVSKGDGELFLYQDKYSNEIMQRFFMESCKHMETNRAIHWRRENVTSYEEVNATIYRNLVGLLMYLVNTLPYM
eukprot:PITA_29679